MNSVIFFLLGIIGLIALLIGFAIISKNKTTPSKKTPPKKDGESGWDKFRSVWFPAISLIIVLIVWYLVSPENFRDNISKKETAAGLLLLVSGFTVLSVYVPFKENWLRRILFAVFATGGVVLIFSNILGFDTEEIKQSISSSNSAESAGVGGTEHRIHTKDYTADGWTEIILPARPFEFEQSSDIQIKLADGRIIDAPKDQWVKLGKIPGPIGKKKIWVRGTQSAGQIALSIK